MFIGLPPYPPDLQIPKMYVLNNTKWSIIKQQQKHQHFANYTL